MHLNSIFSVAIIALSLVILNPTNSRADGEGGVSHVDQKDIKLPKLTPQLRLGQMAYNVYCAACHGKNASGTVSGPTFIQRIYFPGHHPNGSFYRAAKQGVQAHHWEFGNMPKVDDITDTLIARITNYIRAIQQANGIF